MDLLSQVCDLLIIGGGTGIHEDSGSCFEFSSGAIVDLDALRFQGIVLFFIKMYKSLFLAESIIFLKSKLFSVEIVELFINESVILESFIIFEQFLQFLGADDHLLPGADGCVYFIEIVDMLWNGIFEQDLCSRECVLDFIFLYEILVG